jgi:hypothetical protein
MTPEFVVRGAEIEEIKCEKLIARQGEKQTDIRGYSTRAISSIRRSDWRGQEVEYDRPSLETVG